MTPKGIMLVVALVVVIGGGAFVATRGKNTQDANPRSVNGETSKTVPEESVAEPEQAGTLASLFAKRGNFECSVSSKDPSIMSSGSFFISDNKMRGDFSSTVTGMGTIESHMISDGTFAYVWSGMMPQGIKMNVSAFTGAGTTGQMTGKETVNGNTAVEYNCKAWIPDQNKFAVPTSVTFMTLPQQ